MTLWKLSFVYGRRCAGHRFDQCEDYKTFSLKVQWLSCNIVSGVWRMDNEQAFIVILKLFLYRKAANVI